MGVNAAEDGKEYQIDLRREPLINDAICSLVRIFIGQGSGVPGLLSTLSDMGGEKGNLAEWIFCMFVILQVEKQYMMRTTLTLHSLFECLTKDSHLEFLDEAFAAYEVLCI